MFCFFFFFFWHNSLKTFIEPSYHKTIQLARLQAKASESIKGIFAGFNNVSNNSLMECGILHILHRESVRLLRLTSCKWSN
uniref:Putative secreted protein ovary overexpressed n=1 Tax=Rhipicephalus microplus TaxID=6941 RepID=A0A6M2DAB8_RHIMP